MTDKEAIEVIKDLWRYEHSEYSEKQIREALEKGIEALEDRKIGHWIEYKTDKLNFMCSKCHFFSKSNFKYCPDCGCYMRNNANDNEDEQ